MEENTNNNGLLKILLIILIAALGYFVYRTEMMGEELDSCEKTVEQLSARIDSLKIIVKYLSVESHAKTKPTVTASPQVKKSSVVSANAGSSVAQQPKHAQEADSSPQVTGPVKVSAKVKVENRYVSGTTYLPKVSRGPVGVVVINVTMNRVGIVSAVSVNPATTISDDDIIDACKEAALKTSFGYNPEAPNKSTGTIKYIFTAR